MYLSQHGLEEVSVPEPLGDLLAEAVCSVAMAKEVQLMLLRQLHPAGVRGQRSEVIVTPLSTHG